MRIEHDLKLAQADSRIEAAERNIRHVEGLLSQLSEQGFSTVEIEGHLDLMSEALYYLKEQRRLSRARITGRKRTDCGRSVAAAR